MHMLSLSSWRSLTDVGPQIIGGRLSTGGFAGAAMGRGSMVLSGSELAGPSGVVAGACKRDSHYGIDFLLFGDMPGKP